LVAEHLPNLDNLGLILSGKMTVHFFDPWAADIAQRFSNSTLYLALDEGFSRMLESDR
jgi:hypothetical protein